LRVDNGEPFGSPEPSTTPPLALWMIAHQIKMIWNPPRCPQQNGVVERMQQTSYRWAEVKKCSSIDQVQRQLEEAAFIQRQEYPVTRLSGKTRSEAFPKINQTLRKWDKERFNHQLVYDFLSKKVFIRKSSKSGQLFHMGHRINLKSKNGRIAVSIKLNAVTATWSIFNPTGQLIKIEPADYLKPDRILNLTVFQRT